MKRSLMLLLVVFQILLLVSCGSGKKDHETTDTTPDEDHDTADTSDTSSGNDTDPSDTGDTSADSETPDDPDSGSDEPEKNAEGCYIFTVDGSTFSKYYRDTYLGYVKDNILGDKNIVDKFEIDIFQSKNSTAPAESHPGTYDLGTGDNKSYVNCTECVKVFQDHNGKKADKLFFQDKGTLVIESVDSENNIKGTISAKLVEITVDPDTGEAAPVTGGECVAIENWAFDTGVCVPDCLGKVCGGDGCGGKCGEGCSGDLTCSIDQKSCVPFDCEKITFDEVKMHANQYDDYYYETSVSGNVIGSTELEDIMTLHFYGNHYTLAEGKIDLESGDNANYETCTECLLLYEDADFVNNEYGRTFFQQKGELVFDEVKEGTFESRGHGSFRLVEVEIDDYTSESIPVPGGACYEVENLTWDTICIPQCEGGKICGNDGCGGECGEGCGEDLACSADQKSCVAFECTEITMDELFDDQIYPGDNIYSYSYSITPDLGNTDTLETLRFAMYGNIQALRKYKLYGTNLRSSDVNFTLYEDNERMYFQQSGIVEFSSFDLDTGYFEADLTSVRLVEIDVDTDYGSIPVPGGKCVEITNTSLSYPVSD